MFYLRLAVSVSVACSLLFTLVCGFRAGAEGGVDQVEATARALCRPRDNRQISYGVQYFVDSGRQILVPVVKRAKDDAIAVTAHQCIE